MLITARSMKELNFSSLMEVYLEGNLEKAEEGLTLLEAEQDFYQYLRECFFAIPDAIYYVWQEQGKYVSALRLEPYRDGWLLAGLETAPEQRRRGFGERLVRAVLDLQGNALIYSHVHKGNAASLELHKKCGFSVIADTASYIDGSVNQYAFTLCYCNRESGN